jgi:GNAT superfamily N-acetyltransferase
MTHTWRIRDYREGDEEGILDLRQQVFGDVDQVRLLPETWRWQFCDNPAGPPLVALAEDRGRIVGQYAVIPTRFSVYGQALSLALSCDTMIHPDYRRQGLFVELARDVYRRMEEEDRMAAVWGFPNQASLTGFTRHLDWRVLAVYPLRIIPLRPLTMLQKRLGMKKEPAPMPGEKKRAVHAPVSRSIPGLTVQPVARFNREYDELWQRRRNLAPIIQIRDAAYLNWRYTAVPDFGYRPFSVRSGGRPLGYMVIRTLSLMGHFFGVLTDLFPFPIRDLPTTLQLVSLARGVCRDAGAEFMTCLFSRADPAFLRAAGLKTVPAFLNPRQWHFGVRSAPANGTVLGTAADWHLTYGDTDVV